jgi:hypothetical protein
MDRREPVERVDHEEAGSYVGLDNEHQDFDNFPKDRDFSSLQAQLGPSAVLGYSVTFRTWYSVAISRTEEVDWKGEDTLQQLVLEESTKNMLVALVRKHQANKEKVLSDIIPSKGKVCSPLGEV